MNKTVVLLFIAFIVISCDDSNSKKNCETVATIRDLRGLDGCGFVLELADGTILDPQALVSRGADNPTKRDDPYQGIEPVEGKKVMINYTPVEGVANTCMAGQLVAITCISVDSSIAEK